MKKNSVFMTAMAALLLVFGLVLAGCPTDGGGNGGGGFTAQTDNSTNNDADTLGLVGTSASSSDPGVATAAISGGKIVITSVSEGTAVITVSAQDGKSATIAVTVAAGGGITIGAINGGFTAQTDNSTNNDTDTLGLVGTSASSSNPGVATAAIGTGDNAGKIVITSVSEGTAIITVSSAGGKSAAIAVTVADDGGITIDDITRSTWTAANISASGFGIDSTIFGIAYGGGTFVAVGLGTTAGDEIEGRIAYSSDGITWTAAAFNGANPLQYVSAVTYGGGKFVAVGFGGAVAATSTDGVTWAAADTTIPHFSANAVAYGGSGGAEKFVAVLPDARIAYSTDGETWTEASFPGGGFTGLDKNITGVAYGGDTFIAVGTYGQIATSTDGITWTMVDFSGGNPFGTDDHIIAIVYGGGKFLVNKTGTGDNIATSTDGETWTAVSGLRGFSAAAYGDGKFVTVDGSEAMTSTDGTNWTAIANPIVSNDVAYGGGTWVAVGTDYFLDGLDGQEEKITYFIDQE